MGGNDTQQGVAIVIGGESPYRRVVTTRSAAGRSHIFIDGRARNFGTLHEHWMTDGGAPPLHAAVADPVWRPFKIEPQSGGTVFRFVEIEPEAKFAHLSDEERRKAVRFTFSRVASENALVNTARHPAMHQTETVDYIIVLSGCVTMLLDEGEVELRPFDVVVQRGTNHAWVNKSSEPALLAAVLTAAR